MAIQWENFNGRDRGLLVDINILIDREDGTSGWAWYVSTDLGAVRVGGEERFRIGDDEGKQKALTLAIEYLEGAVTDVLDEMKEAERAQRIKEDREDPLGADDDYSPENERNSYD